MKAKFKQLATKSMNTTLKQASDRNSVKNSQSATSVPEDLIEVIEASDKNFSHRKKFPPSHPKSKTKLEKPTSNRRKDPETPTLKPKKYKLNVNKMRSTMRAQDSAQMFPSIGMDFEEESRAQGKNEQGTRSGKGKKVMED